MEPFDERAFIEHFEAADPDELARLLTLSTRRESDALAAWLGERRYRQMHEEALRRNVRRSDAPLAGNVVVVPGFMGSQLTGIDSTGLATTVWMRPLQLLAGAVGRLRLDPGGVQQAEPDWTVTPTAILKKHYGELILSLSARYRVLPFFYDWRKDVRIAGKELAARIANSLEGGPTHIVAHSMGGLVARSFIDDHAEQWQAMGGRLVLLGPPHRGSQHMM